ncbi:hypothetical protein ACFXKR_09350 [Streptomyces violascens]|uniref:ATP-dependent DNA ligase n=1 Tax=Streptomyces violascens TaxID=67381 RepID=UPI0036C848EA
MLATLSARRDFAAGWVFERKLDGIRVLAVREGDTLTLRSRSGRRLDTTYPEIVNALAAQACADFTIDGEIVAYSHGRTDFARLQQRMGLTRPADVAASKVAVTYYVFDLLRLDGKDVRRLPLRTRKSLLRRALTSRTAHTVRHRSVSGLCAATLVGRRAQRPGAAPGAGRQGFPRPLPAGQASWPTPVPAPALGRTARTSSVLARGREVDRHRPGPTEGTSRGAGRAGGLRDRRCRYAVVVSLQACGRETLPAVATGSGGP